MLVSDRAPKPQATKKDRAVEPFRAQRARAGGVAEQLRESASTKGWSHPDTQALWDELRRLIELVDGARDEADEG